MSNLKTDYKTGDVINASDFNAITSAINNKVDANSNSISLTKSNGENVTLDADKLEEILSILPDYQESIDILNEL